MRILIVDDEEDARAIAQLALEMKTDWTIFTASSGQEALNLAQIHQPDVILLDMMMPQMDGTKTLQKLKENSKTLNIPVILVTAKINSAQKTNFDNLDVIAVLAKPYRPLTLAEQIQASLDKMD